MGVSSKVGEDTWAIGGELAYSLTLSKQILLLWLMIRFSIQAIALSVGLLGLAACSSQSAGNPNYVYQPTPGQGQYVRPAYLLPQPTESLSPVDVCRSQLFIGLVGRHEGAIYIPGLPGRKRVLKPVFQEFENDMFVEGLDPNPPFIEVRDFLPGQQLYAPSITTVRDAIEFGPVDETRLTIELDDEGYVDEVRCG